ncbi:MAG: transketolase [Candidatus Omnitrophica bacterium]|nr:transketolase [Candidatus Omnitrophota bacterium]
MDLREEDILGNNIINKDLRKRIIEIVYNAQEGHITSSFSIIDILAYLYENILKFDNKKPLWEDRDYFILSKGHGCVALYVILQKYGFITEDDLRQISSKNGILGGHPDITKVPGVEASTGSLGHGIGTALGVALGLRIRSRDNKVIALIGDGESNEGTVWECALVGANLNLGNLCCIVDNNGSAAQVLPVPDMQKKWDAFGWETYVINGHSQDDIQNVFGKIKFEHNTKPKVIIANTLKGKGVSFMEGHGSWHARIPSADEFKDALKELADD